MTLDDKEILTINDVASRFGVERGAVYAWIKDGHLKPIRFLGKQVFLKESLASFEPPWQKRGEHKPGTKRGAKRKPRP